MTLAEIDISGTLQRAKAVALKDETLSSTVRSLLEVLVLIIELMLRRLNLNSGNSSVAPSQDPHRKRGAKVVRGERRKPGGQRGHKGETIQRVENPDHVELLGGGSSNATERASLPGD